MVQRKRWTFRQATDAVKTRVRVTLAHVAERFGIEPGSLSRWRREGPNSPPPEDWATKVAALAEETAESLRVEATRLEQLGRELRAQADKRP
ncbi:MAG TPA: transposase [Gemmatimonadaceae bacterium]|nr:transposase [Gemmatimonadaceae bacterium]